MVPTRRHAILLRHVFRLEIPSVTLSAEMSQRLGLGLVLLLSLSAFVHINMIDRDMTVTKEAPGLHFLKIEISKIRNRELGCSILLLILISIFSGVLDVGIFIGGLTRLGCSLNVLCSPGLLKVSL